MLAAVIAGLVLEFDLCCQHQSLSEAPSAMQCIVRLISGPTTAEVSFRV